MSKKKHKKKAKAAAAAEDRGNVLALVDSAQGNVKKVRSILERLEKTDDLDAARQYLASTEFMLENAKGVLR